MGVRDCLNDLVSQGIITRRSADAADALWRRYQGKFSLDMPPAQADAAAALQAAREMMARSQEQKRSVALQVIRQTTVEKEAFNHPWGPVAGAMAALTRDIYRLGGANVDTRAQTLRETLFSKFNEGVEAYKSTFAGLKQNTAGVRNMVGELFGVDSGDPIAKAAADGWLKSTAWAVAHAKKAGKIFEENENWRLPQPWSADRVRRFGMGAEFRRDVQEAVDSGGLQIWDKERLEIATDPARITDLIDKAARDIITEGASANAFSKERRTFDFQQGQAGFDAWTTLQGKYGSGQDIFSMLNGHLGSMAQEMALVDVLGPQHASTVATLVKNAVAYEGHGKPGEGRLRPARMLRMESASAIRRTYDVLNGRANGVENAFWGGLLGSARSMMAASSLGSATVAASVGDSVTVLLASRYNGIEGAKVLKRAIEIIFGDNPQAQEDAARLLVTGHAISDHAVSTLRYSDQMVTPELVRKTADFVIRASGLSAWTEGIKKAFTMEFLGYIAKHAGKQFADLDEPFRMFLDRYRVTPAEWDVLRARPLHDFRGAKFFDSSQAAEDPLTAKLFEGILNERALAVLEPDARVRSVTTQGQRSGTFAGEAARSLTMFQSFSMTMVMTHLHAIAIRDGVAGNRAMNAALFFGSHILAGAAILQARQLLQGKDPIKMDQPKFWMQATAQGGGLGYFGDLVGGIAGGAASRSITGKFSGPLGGLVDDVGQFGYSAWKQQPGTAHKGVELLRHVTPGQNLWWTRLATDRLIFDQFQRMIDPHYAQSFAKKEARAMKAYGQQYWWHPGQVTPERAASLTR